MKRQIGRNMAKRKTVCFLEIAGKDVTKLNAVRAVEFIRSAEQVESDG